MNEPDNQKAREYIKWAYREAVRTEFLETKEEIHLYMSALYEAALWGENVK